MPIVDYNSDVVGSTPLVKLRRLTDGLGATILAKLESRNFSHSVKGRCVTFMLNAAEKSGALTRGKRVLEATSGNTGIALAYACAARGYPLTLVMPDGVSSERVRLLEAFGTELIRTPAKDDMPGAVAKARELATSSRFAFIDQFSNTANANCHFYSTGPEIWRQTAGNIDFFVSCVGSGGTLTGTARYFKQRKKRVTCVAVEPANCATLSTGAIGKHSITGISPGFISSITDPSLIDDVVTVTESEAWQMPMRIAREEGILCGASGGAAVAAALEIARRPNSSGKTIVAILADSGERYLSTRLFESRR